MGVDSRRPPLPAPTESIDDNSGVETELATNVTSRTDKTSWSIPEDGRPITISTQKTAVPGKHTRDHSHTSLLIEYFEASRTADKSKSRPSVRVKVTPSSAAKKSRAGSEAIQITGLGADRKPSYTRRISLGSRSRNIDAGLEPADGTELSHSSDSNVSRRPPLEIEVLNNNSPSDVSHHRSSRDLSYAPIDSNVSSMPPDSMLEGDDAPRDMDSEDDETTPTRDRAYLKAPPKIGTHSRNASQERLAQKVMEKLGASSKLPKSSRSREYDPGETSEASHRSRDATLAGAQSRKGSSIDPALYRSGGSHAPQVTNNPKLLEMVEDTIKRMIMPEIDALRQDQQTSGRNSASSDRGEEYGRRVSKSSSSPTVTSKPKVVLNRDSDDPGVVLSRGDSEKVKQRKSSRESPSERPSSRRSSGRSSRQGSYDDTEERIRHKSSRGSNTLRGAASAGLAGGLLTSAALQQHDSQSDIQRRRKKRSKSRSSHSRSHNDVEGDREGSGETTIPPMPMASAVNESDLTRDSILSQDAARLRSRPSADVHTPTRELSRELGGSELSPIPSRTPTRSPDGWMTNKDRLAALTAAGLGGSAAAVKGLDADGYGEITHRKTASPVQSVSSLRRNFEDDEDNAAVPRALRPRSAAASRSRAAGQLRSTGPSQSSLRSTDSPPTTTKLADSRKQSHDGESTATPNGETAEEWFERQHRVNDRYRDSFQSNPFPEDENRFTTMTDDSFDRPTDDNGMNGEQGVRDVGLNPNYVHPTVGVESAVASLMEPSSIGSNAVSADDSPAKTNGGTYSDRMAQHLRAMSKDQAPMYEGSTLSQTMPSQARWSAIRGHAKNLSASIDSSPRQSPAKDARYEDSTAADRNVSASALPLANDPMPEIGHFDDSKSATTDRSIVKEPLGGDFTGNNPWPYTPEPQHPSSADREQIGRLKEPNMPSTNDIQREPSPPGFRDEGYVTDAPTRSGGGITPQPRNRTDRKDPAPRDSQDAEEDDPFITDTKRTRHFSGNSHGMESPLYDSSTGKGLNNIESKDIVALMDHLTVRDAQRNARDTEILVTLVRSAAEMRQSFDEMKKFIVEQDKLIMQNTDRSVDSTAQKVLLSGPRPQPSASPRTPRRQLDSEEDVQTKRKGVLRRALKGLTGGKSAKDLGKIEDMLMQILDNVEDLKMQNGSTRPVATNESLDSYDKLRGAPDPGYEPDGQAGTSSTPSHSGFLNAPGPASVPREKQQFHSGYDGRRGSEHRVSTVLEEEDDDDDALAPHESHVLSHQFENNERMLTPTNESYRDRERGMTTDYYNSPRDRAINSAEKQQKHKSNSSSLFGVPKISRWSKTTASSAAPDLATVDSPRQARNVQRFSGSARSHSTLDDYDDDDDSSYRAREDTRATGHASEARSLRSQASRQTRTPSPLIPSEASSKHRGEYDDDGPADSPVQEDDEAALLDDPKYHAHRNSILLQHPQPRPGPTPRHQNALESKAHTFADDPTGTNSDLSQRTASDFDPAVWGSSGTAGLARHRLSQIAAESVSPASRGSRGGDDGPLVPQQQQQQQQQKPTIRYDPEPEPDHDWEPQFSNSGFSKYYGNQGGQGSSPYGSGHLLEPIEEVRYSLETDSGRRSMGGSISPEPQLASARAVEMRSPGRKITGPRPMTSGSGGSGQQARLVESSGAGGMGTVRRKPVARSEASDESETF